MAADTVETGGNLGVFLPTPPILQSVGFAGGVAQVRPWNTVQYRVSPMASFSVSRVAVAGSGNRNDNQVLSLQAETLSSPVMLSHPVLPALAAA